MYLLHKIFGIYLFVTVAQKAERKQQQRSISFPMANQSTSPLRRYPAYGDNHIEENIVFDTYKRSTMFGRPYLFTNEHKIRERNKFLYKLTSDLNDDSFTCASQSQSNYSELSYRSNFDDYYYPMPPTYKEVHTEAEENPPKDKPPTNYGFKTYNPPFELRRASVRQCMQALKATNNRLIPSERKKTQSEKLQAQQEHEQPQQEQQQQQKEPQRLATKHTTNTGSHEFYKPHKKAL